MAYRFVANANQPIGHPLRGYHECGPTRLGRYRMDGAWIDTDNQVWSEPYHEYTAPPAPRSKGEG